MRILSLFLMLIFPGCAWLEIPPTPADPPIISIEPMAGMNVVEISEEDMYTLREIGDKYKIDTIIFYRD